MALLNYLFSGSYLRAESISIEKLNRRVTARMCLYRSKNDIGIDETPLSFHISVEGHLTIPSFLSLTPFSIPPENPPAGKFFIVGDNPTGDWEGTPSGYFAVWNAAYRVWDRWEIPEGYTYYVEDVGRYYKFHNSNWMVVDVTADSRIWEKYFRNQENVAESLYDFLKTMSKFSDCVDG